MNAEFILTSLVVILLPGTGVIYTLAYGLGQGFRASLYAAFGCTLGIVPALLAAVVGLAAVLHTSSLGFQLIKYLGVAYLFYMAWGVLREGGALEVSEKRRPESPGKIVRNGFLLNILNPKLSLFFLAFLPQFVSAGAPHESLQMLVLGGVFMLLTFVVFIVYGACASMARDYIIGKPAAMLWLRRGFAGAFTVLGMRLALAER